MKGSPLSMSDFISVVCFIPQPCFTHFRLPHHLVYIHWTGRAPLNSETSGHPFPPISPENNHTYFSEGSPLSMSDFIPVVCSTPQPCGTHFRLPHDLAYIHCTGRATLNFEPSGHPFPPISPQYNYFYFMKRSPLSMSDFIPVVWFPPQPCGTHFRLPHHLAYMHWTGRASLDFEPSGHPFPPISPQHNHTHFMKGSPWAWRTIPVVSFNTKPCGTRFRSPHHLAYIHWTGWAPLKFVPSSQPFAPNSP